MSYNCLNDIEWRIITRIGYLVATALRQGKNKALNLQGFISFVGI